MRKRITFEELFKQFIIQNPVLNCEDASREKVHKLWELGVKQAVKIFEVLRLDLQKISGKTTNIDIDPRVFANYFMGPWTEERANAWIKNIHDAFTLKINCLPQEKSTCLFSKPFGSLKWGGRIAQITYPGIDGRINHYSIVNPILIPVNEYKGAIPKKIKEQINRLKTTHLDYQPMIIKSEKVPSDIFLVIKFGCNWNQIVVGHLNESSKNYKMSVVGLTGINLFFIFLIFANTGLGSYLVMWLMVLGYHSLIYLLSPFLKLISPIRV